MRIDFEPARERLIAAVEAGVPSLAVAVAHRGEVIWEEAFGLADRAGAREADASTPYSLASITKPMTATAILLLVERGQIDLARPIDDYLGDVGLRARVGDASAATVERVLMHTAGLPTHYQFFYEDEAFGRPPFEESIRRYAFCSTAPGEAFEYSNLGYGLLDYVIERVSGRSYADFMRGEVFEPLGMKHSGIGPLTGHALRYFPSGGPIPDYVVDHPGASMAYASAADLVRFGLFHRGQRQPGQVELLRAGTLARMRRSETQRAPGLRYGLGWQLSDAPAVVSHGGGMPGVSTQLMLLPDHDAVVALLCNRTPGWQRDGLAGLVQELVGALPGPELPDPPPNPMLAEHPPFRPRPEHAGTWRGAVHTHEGEHPTALQLEPDGTVRLDLADREGIEPLRAFYLDDSLQLAFDGANVPTRDTARAQRHLLNLVLHHRGDRLAGQAVARETLSSERMRFALSHWIELRT